MKPSLLAIILAGTAFCGTAWAQTNTPGTLGTSTVTGIHAGNTYQRDITVMRDGSVSGVIRDGDQTTHVQLSVEGGQAVFIRRNPWTVSTNVTSLNAYDTYLRNHPSAAATLDTIHRETAFLTQRRNDHSNTHVTPMVGGDGCASQAQEVIDTADWAISECSSYPGSNGCNDAEQNYASAVAALSACERLRGAPGG